MKKECVCEMWMKGVCTLSVTWCAVKAIVCVCKVCNSF